MANSKRYDISYLQERQAEITERNSEKILTTFNKLTALFPLKQEEFETINTPWAFKCLCGSYVVQDYNAVRKGQNKSCGCHRQSMSNRKYPLRALLKSERTSVKILKIGSSAGSRDWTMQCVVCGFTHDKCNVHEHLVQENKFCKCSNRCTNLSYEEIKEECLQYSSDSTWKIISFPEQYTTKRELRILLGCKECSHEVSMLYGNYIRGRGCAECANTATTLRQLKDTAWFVERGNTVHNYKYDYSKTEYRKAREKVEIICNEHKHPFPFWQSPDNHLNKGKGCPECKRLRLRYVSFHLAKVQENRDFYSTLPSGVYIGKLEDGLYKIGLTCNQHKRFKEIKKDSGFDIQLIKYKEMNLYEALMLEHTLHKEYEEYNHIFENTWQGHSECFSLADDQVENIKTKLVNHPLHMEINYE